MREVVLDTETTGLDPNTGDRIVEIGAVELFNHMPTGKTYHQYINPERSMPDGAFAVHGLGDEFLADKPIFRDIAAAFLEFVGTSKMVIHNASFDMKFINAELEWAAIQKMPYSQALDTLEIARRKFPGAQNSLDALCRRFGVDNSSREKHGALLDSELLAEVYLELVGGRQPDFALNVEATATTDSNSDSDGEWRPGQRPTPLQPYLSDEETARHSTFVEALGEKPLWKKFQ